MSAFSRRRLLKLLAATSVMGVGPAVGQEKKAAGKPAKTAKPQAATELSPLQRWPRMVQEYYVQRLRRHDADHARRIYGIKTRAQAEQFVAGVQKKIADCFGPMPEKTPLNPRLTGSVERDAYVIEKVIFESRPNFPVTGNLYLPKGGGKKPGVVGVCGHSANGKAAEAYQSFAQGLSRLGYVCFIIDPIGQGERLQYADENLKPRHGVGVAEHLYGGNQQFLVGEFFGSWRAWDGIRALDYLLTRPEVDPKHIGLTGNSGGGTMTTWLCGLERRWTMAAPSCFVTSFRRNMENELPADTEQCPPGALAAGLDHADFIAAMAPKPVIVMGQEKDFFDTRGLTETYHRLKHLYTLLGAPDNIALAIGPDPHGYTQANRTSMYRFFNKITGVSNTQEEPAITVEKDEILHCTPHGQVAELKPRTMQGFTAEKARRMEQGRRLFKRAAIQQVVHQSLNLPRREAAPDYRILRPLSKRNYPMPGNAHYAVETEEGISALVTRLYPSSHVSPPRGAGQEALLYVAHQSADAELRESESIKRWLAENKEGAVYAMDVRGIGQSKPDTCGTDAYANPYGADYFYAIHALMFNEPMLGRRTHDVLSVVDWMKAAGHPRIHVLGAGWGALPAALAALLHEGVNQVTLQNALSSWRIVAESEEYKLPLSNMLFGVLASWDLPEVYAALAGKQLKMIDPVGAIS